MAEILTPMSNLLASLPPVFHSFGLLLAQASDNPYANQPAPNPVTGIIGLLLVVIGLVSLWKIFTKAGRPGWASIVPIYNAIVLCHISGKSGWWVLLMFIPLVNFVALIIIFIGLAKNFGKSAGFGIGAALLSFIFLPILAFGDARYQGPSAAPALT